MSNATGYIWPYMTSEIEISHSRLVIAFTPQTIDEALDIIYAICGAFDVPADQRNAMIQRAEARAYIVTTTGAWTIWKPTKPDHPDHHWILTVNGSSGCTVLGNTQHVEEVIKNSLKKGN